MMYHLDIMIDIEEVPNDVMKSVYGKWREAYVEGWENKLWGLCAMCHWVSGCDVCPLRKGNWCTSNALGSRIHIRFNGSSGEDAWKDRIKDFLIFLKPYCKGDNYD